LQTSTSASYCLEFTGVHHHCPAPVSHPNHWEFL
jgi:hypothetical protein